MSYKTISVSLKTKEKFDAALEKQPRNITADLFIIKLLGKK